MAALVSRPVAIYFPDDCHLSPGQSGHAMMGFSLGPITGRLIADILSGEKPFLDIRLLEPDRYS